jgi:hypothetical protein
LIVFFPFLFPTAPHKHFPLTQNTTQTFPTNPDDVRVKSKGEGVKTMRFMVFIPIFMVLILKTMVFLKNQKTKNLGISKSWFWQSLDTFDFDLSSFTVELSQN